MKTNLYVVAILGVLSLGSSGISWCSEDTKVRGAFNGDMNACDERFLLGLEQGVAPAQYFMGLCVADGQNGANPDYKNAAKWYTLAAEQGYSQAQEALGYLYQEGLGVRQNYEVAMKWHKLAAENGNQYSRMSVGRLYERGLGVTQSDKTAFEWYYSAVEGNRFQGFEIKLGEMYEQGKGVTQNFEEALKLYQLPARQGYPNALYNIGNMYEEGRGVRQSDRIAARWYRDASLRGSARAANKLGSRFLYDKGFRRDYKAAKSSFMEAAKQGDADALYHLGLLYAEGKGVPQDYVVAYMWLDLSASKADEKAIDRRYKIAKKMSSADLTAAKKYSMECQAKDFKNCYKSETKYSEDNRIKRNIMVMYILIGLIFHSDGGI